MAKEKNTVYDSFKFFKNIYTQFNVAENVYFIYQPTASSITLLFSKDSPFYFLTGSISSEYLDIEFFQWLKTGKCIKIPMTEFVELGKVLKKNAISAMGNENEFEFKFIDKTTEVEKNFIYKNLEVPNEILTKINTYEATLQNVISIPSESFEAEIFEVYKDNEKLLINERKGEKILEIPSAKVLSLLKNSKVEFKFAEKDSEGKRFVQISSMNEDGLCLKQLFLTI